MKRKLLVISVLFALLFSLFTGCQPRFQPGTYTDDTGRTVAFDQVPRRLVSFGPSITEILFALGLEESVVGVSSYCDYPEAAKSKAKVGDAFNPSLEKIVELEPDLVLTVKQEQLQSELEALGIRFLVLDPKDIDGILADIGLMGEITDTRSKAEALIGDMQSSISQVTLRAEDAPKVRVFYIVDATDPTLPWTAGSGSFIDALITLAGGENIAGSAPGAWVSFSLEQIVSAEPEVIIVQTMTGGLPTISEEELEAGPVWGKMTAVAQGKIYLVDGDLVSRPGPRIVQGLEAIARAIHPELFD